MSAKKSEPVPQQLTRKERKAATRAGLLAAAQRSFAEKGFVDTQIGDITKEAGVAHGTFYVHFSNKEELLQELLEGFNEQLLERVAAIRSEAREGDTTLEGLVRQVAHTFLDHWLGHRDFVHAYAQKAALGTSVKSLRDGLSPHMLRFLTASLQETATTLSAPVPDAELVTHGLLAMWMRIGLQALFNDDVTPARAEDALVSMTCGVLRHLLPNLTPNDPPTEP